MTQTICLQLTSRLFYEKETFTYSITFLNNILVTNRSNLVERNTGQEKIKEEKRKMNSGREERIKKEKNKRKY